MSSRPVECRDIKGAVEINIIVLNEENYALRKKSFNKKKKTLIDDVGFF